MYILLKLKEFKKFIQSSPLIHIHDGVVDAL